MRTRSDIIENRRSSVTAVGLAVPNLGIPDNSPYLNSARAPEGRRLDE